MKLKNIFKMLFLVLGLIFMMVGQAHAIPIQTDVEFIETASGVKAYIDGVDAGSTTGESIAVTLSYFHMVVPLKYYQDILEPDGMTLSDRILWDFKGSGLGTVITFGSGPTFPDISGAIKLGEILGNGTLQAAFGPWTSSGATYSLYTSFQSEIGQSVPEPATMLLLGTGLVGLVGFRRKFKKS